MNNLPRYECHCHSMFSNFRLLDAISKPEDIISRAIELGLSGICLTDHETVAGIPKFFSAAEKYPDFKVAAGNEIYLCKDREPNQKYYHFILNAKNFEGWKALKELSSKAWMNSFFDRGMERVVTTYKDLKEIVNKYPNSLIATTACFVKGTQVQTKEGYKNIEDITSNDYIYNKYGKWEKVNFPTSRFYQGEGQKISFFELNDTITCTNNHQFLVTTQNWLKTKKPARWIEAKDLKLEKGNQKHICLFPISPVYSNKNIIYRKEWENSLRKINYKPKYLLKNEILLSPEIMRLFGLWLGDGYISITEKSKRVGITFSLKEFNSFWENFVRKASEEIGIVWTKQIIEKQNKVELTSSSIEVVELFYYLFGLSHAHNKYIPDRLKHISEEFDWNLFWGYALADGHFRTRTKDKYSYGEFCSTSISKKLTQDFQEILKSLGIRSSIVISKEKIDKNYIHHNEAYYLTSSNNAWININKIENYDNEYLLKILNDAQLHDSKKHCIIDGIKYKKVYIKKIEEVQLNQDVYCLNVDSHSFCCQGVIVHNCLGGELSTQVKKLIKAEQHGDEQSKIESHNQIVNFIIWCKEIFGDDFYIECAPGCSRDQILVNQRLVSIAQCFKIKMVIGTDAHYLKKEDRYIHKSYLNSKGGEREVDDFYEYSYLQTTEEIFNNLRKSNFDDLFIKELFNNSLEICDKIEKYSIWHNQTIPKIEVKDYPKKDCLNEYPHLHNMYKSDDIIERYWVNQCVDKLHEIDKFNETYLSRLEEEATTKTVIGNKLGTNIFAYPIVLQHYINMFWECGSTVGAGRGSSCAGLNHFLLNVTQINPVEWNFPWFRYLNEERIELPDIDIDLAPSKRPLILQQIKNERGKRFNSDIDELSRENLGCTLIATYGTETSKSAIQTACRGYRSEEYPDGIDNDISQYLSSLVPVERGFVWSLHEVYYGNEEKGRKPIITFINEVNKYPGLLDIMFGIEGSTY